MLRLLLVLILSSLLFGCQEQPSSKSADTSSPDTSAPMYAPHPGSWQLDNLASLTLAIEGDDGEWPQGRLQVWDAEQPVLTLDWDSLRLTLPVTTSYPWELQLSVNAATASLYQGEQLILQRSLQCWRQGGLQQLRSSDSTQRLDLISSHKQFQPSPTHILIWGNGLYPESSSERPWPVRFAEALHSRGAPLRLRLALQGEPGQPPLLGNWRQSLESQLAGTPAMVIVLLGEPESLADMSVAVFRKEGKALVDLIRAAGAMPVLVTPPPPPARGDLYDRRAALATELRQLAVDNGYPVADLWDRVRNSRLDHYQGPPLMDRAGTLLPDGQQLLANELATTIDYLIRAGQLRQ